MSSVKETIIPIPDFPTNEETIDAIQQLQRIVEQLQDALEEK